MKCLQFGSSTKKYSATIRRFAFTLNFYSPKGYDYVREIFNRHLPAARTLRTWYSSINGSPGFTDESFDALKERAKIEKENGKQLSVCLMFDAMYIRQHSQWDRATKKYLGHNMTRNKSNNSCLPLATQALVFMVCGIQNDFKLPIGYFLNNGAKSDEIADMNTEIMYRLSQIGVQLVSITYDGAAENVAAAKRLGATLENPFILNRFDNDNKVYLILDPPHMIKLARNCLGNNGVLYDGNGGEINWQYICNLANLQNSENINLGNKITKSHIDFKDNKMNVRLAVQTLSNSTAFSIEYLETHMKNPNFSNSGPTREYIQVFNNLFDIMNSKPKHCNDEYKRPFSTETEQVFMNYFDYAKKIIKGYSIMDGNNKKLVLNSRSFTPFYGFVQNMESFKGIYYDNFKDRNSNKFYTFAASQDHAESFFGCIRRMNGCNDNPSEQQFIAAYKKLLFHNEVTTSLKSNVLNDVTKILTVSSGEKTRLNYQQEHDLQLLADYDLENPEADFADPEETSDTVKLNNHARAYLASKVELGVIQKIFKKGRKGCLQCINVFMENEITDDEFIAFRYQTDQIHQPCKSTLTIIHDIERYLNKYAGLEVSFGASVTHILKNIDTSKLFQNSDFSADHDHKTGLIKFIIEVYSDLKSTYVSQLITRLSKKELVRHNKTKDIHQAGQ